MIASFPKAVDDEVPIIGKPFDLIDFWPTVLIQCKCSPSGSIAKIIGQNGGECPSCKKVYFLEGYAWDKQTNSLKLQLGCSLPNNRGVM